MAELSDVIAGEPYTRQLFDSLPLEQNAKFFVADFRAFLKRDLICACEHQRRDYERDSPGLLPHACNGKIEPPAIFGAFETQVPNVLLRLFHNESSLYLIHGEH
jgi:hypothetical protein